MHYWCRDTCALCRLPAGRPRLPFGWQEAGGRGAGAGSSSAGADRARVGSLDALASSLGRTLNPSWQPGARLARAHGPSLASSEWHSLHAVGGGGGSARLHRAITQDLMVHGLAAWLMLAAVAACVAASSLWVWRRARRGARGAAAAVRPGDQARLRALSSALRLSCTSSGSGTASPPHPLLGRAGPERRGMV